MNGRLGEREFDIVRDWGIHQSRCRRRDGLVVVDCSGRGRDFGVIGRGGPRREYFGIGRCIVVVVWWGMI